MILKFKGILSGNALKIIAAAAMLADHTGFLLLPQYGFLRIIGRLAFPIFAFMIAEGCKYTKNKVKYFAMVACLATVCQVVYYIFDKSLYMSVLVSFSLAILMVFALQNCKATMLAHESTLVQKVLSASLFASLVVLVYLINLWVEVDYGFWGCMMPVAASLFHAPKNCESNLNSNNETKNKPLQQLNFLQKLDIVPVNVLAMAAAMIPLTLSIGWVQPYSFFALVPLMLYSGKRGKYKMKYFFYIFYPLHLVLLQGISMLMSL